jgi:undecaprenyl-diphosphatase
VEEAMNIWESVILGAVQGVTEFLPVSSFGHLVILQHLMDVGTVPVLYDILLHFATLVVIVFFFRIRIGRIAGALLRAVGGKTREGDAREVKIFGIIILGTIFTGVIGLAVRQSDAAENEALVFLFFIVTGVLLILGSAIKPKKTVDQAGVLQGIIVGTAQGLGTLPGISRSGITITAALLSGVSREKAAELSFLFSLPAILGALLLEIGTAEALSNSTSFGIVAAGMIAAALTGFFSLKLLLAVIRSRKLYLFSIYLIPLGIIGSLLI